MSLKDECEMLRRVPLFANISAAKLKLLAFTSDRVEFRSGQVLFNQGDHGDAAYLLLSGSADILINSPSGEVKVGSVGADDIVGETAILCDVARTATIKTTTAVVALRIWRDHFLRLLVEFPEISIEIMRMLASRLSLTTADLTEARSQLKQLAK